MENTGLGGGREDGEDGRDSGLPSAARGSQGAGGPASSGGLLSWLPWGCRAGTLAPLLPKARGQAVKRGQNVYLPLAEREARCSGAPLPGTDAGALGGLLVTGAGVPAACPSPGGRPSPRLSSLLPVGKATGSGGPPPPGAEAPPAAPQLHSDHAEGPLGAGGPPDASLGVDGEAMVRLRRGTSPGQQRSGMLGTLLGPRAMVLGGAPVLLQEGWTLGRISWDVVRVHRR